MSDLGPGVGNAINNNGDVVGWSFVGGFDHAFLYSSGGMTDLAPYLVNIGIVFDSFATGINDNGDIVGYGEDSMGNNHAFLLTPVPEPSSLWLLAMGGLVLLRRRATELTAVTRWRKRRTRRGMD